MLALLCVVAAGIACAVGSIVFVASWWMWPRRTDGLAKPGGAITCRLAQSALFASAAALLWWTAPLVGVVLLVARCRRRRAPTAFDLECRRAAAENLRQYMRAGVYAHKSR